MVAVDEVPDRVVASALEIAVGIAAAGLKVRPVPPFPVGLKPYLKMQKLPPKALAEVRRIVEEDDGFRRRLARVVPDDLLDEGGKLWLRRPEGWEDRLREVAATNESPDPAAALRRAEKRREAAEQAARRAIAEHVGLVAENERLAAELADVRAALSAVRDERDDLSTRLAERSADVRRLQNRVTAATEAADRARTELAEERERADEAERRRDDLLADRVVRPDAAGADAVVLAGAADVAADLAGQAEVARELVEALRRSAERLTRLEPRRRPPAAPTHGSESGRRRRPASARRPIGLPGGVYGSSTDAAEFLVRHPGVVVLVDGYNVAKLGWPSLPLEQQRERCVEACEDVVRRFGTLVHVVFDGADVEGAASSARRLVRVQWSPAGVLADDVLRAEVAALPDETPVVVVTNDQAVQTDVRMVGANTLSSEQWLAVAGR